MPAVAGLTEEHEHRFNYILGIFDCDCGAQCAARKGHSRFFRGAQRGVGEGGSR